MHIPHDKCQDEGHDPTHERVNEPVVPRRVTHGPPTHQVSQERRRDKVVALPDAGDGQAGDFVRMLGLVGALELERYFRLGPILVLVAGGGDGVGHNEVHVDRDVGVQAGLHDEGVGQGT